eukprot:9935344-Lingulodinium_polyedra.AAC.1
MRLYYWQVKDEEGDTRKRKEDLLLTAEGTPNWEEAEQIEGALLDGGVSSQAFPGSSSSSTEAPPKAKAKAKAK